MKKAVNLFLLVLAMLSPTILSAQTSNEKWVSLGEYLQENYKKKGKYLVPKYTNNYQYVTKLAYKKPESNIILPKGNIIINMVNYIENHGIPVFNKDGAIVVNELFEISQNGKPVNGYIVEGDPGWEIIDLNGVGSLTSVLMKKTSKTGNNDILDHIYVTLDDSQNPYKIKEEILKTSEEKRRKEEQSKSSKDYSPIIIPLIQ